MPFSALIFGPVGQVIGPDRAVMVAGIVLIAWALLLVARPAWLQSDRGIRAGGRTGRCPGMNTTETTERAV